jgi:hypothetical protein
MAQQPARSLLSAHARHEVNGYTQRTPGNEETHNAIDYRVIGTGSNENGTTKTRLTHPDTPPVWAAFFLCHPNRGRRLHHVAGRRTRWVRDILLLPMPYDMDNE